MKTTILKLMLCPIVGYIAYIFGLMYVFDMNFNLQLLKVSIDVLKSLNPNDIHKLKWLTFLPLGLGLFVLSISIFFSLLKESNSNNYGESKFASNTEKGIEKLGLNYKKGLILAKWKEKPIRFNAPLACLVVAPPGTGKTSSIAIPNLLTVENSFVVLDIKGELIRDTAGYRQKVLKNKIFIFSPMSGGNTMKFNPFDEKCVKNMNYTQRKRLTEEVANTIFIPEKGKDANDFWLSSAKKLFVFFALYDLCTKGKTTFWDLSQAIQKDYYEELEDDFKKECMYEELNEEDQTILLKRDINADTLRVFLRQISLKQYNPDELHNTSPQEFVFVQNEARSYANAPKETFGGYVANYTNYLNVFTNPDVAEATNSMSFEYGDLREKKITLYINIAQTDIDTLAPLVRVFLESIAKNLMLNENSNPDKFIYLMLDEFIRFGSMNFILRMPELCRSYGIIPIYITQSYQQIEVTYSKQDVEILLANVASQVIFRMNALEDAKKISDTIGDFTRKKHSISRSNMKFIENNKSISEEGYKLLTPQDIMTQDNRKVLILISGFKNTPLRADRNAWFESEELKRRKEIQYDSNL